MRRAEILDQLQVIVRHMVDAPDLVLREEQALGSLVSWDSLVQTRTIVEVESRFDVLFDLDELAALRTVGGLIDIVERKLAGR